MGVFPISGESYPELPSLPHARGGVSIDNGKLAPSNVSSPRPWGCFS
ncbi:hypothetical protein BMETH_321_0 [methanotrophic bacterial endosymbiont of Bathymodiolus sp.]|nr:hypothetical protein BMETH_321_0 [methanotrophic bacterial endosymbiont of Bathymodiolus sp.]